MNGFRIKDRCIWQLDICCFRTGRCREISVKNEKRDLLDKLRSMMKSINELADEFIEEIDPFG